MGRVLQVWEAVAEAWDGEEEPWGETDVAVCALSCPVLPTKVEANIIDLNLLKKSEVSGPCWQCAQPCSGEDSVMCGYCGRAEHRGCSLPRARHTYWYCEECLLHLNDGDAINDPALDTTM